LLFVERRTEANIVVLLILYDADEIPAAIEMAPPFPRRADTLISLFSFHCFLRLRLHAAAADIASPAAAAATAFITRAAFTFHHVGLFVCAHDTRHAAYYAAIISLVTASYRRYLPFVVAFIMPPKVGLPTLLKTYM